MFVHVDLPGQEDDAEEMGDDTTFPTMQVKYYLLLNKICHSRKKANSFQALRKAVLGGFQ